MPFSIIKIFVYKHQSHIITIIKTFLNLIIQFLEMKKYMGIHIGHNASVSLIDDYGKVIFSAEEERFSRKKMQSGFPQLTLDYIKNNYGFPDNINISQVRPSHFYLRLIGVAKHGILFNKSGPNLSSSIKFAYKSLKKNSQVASKFQKVL